MKFSNIFAFGLATLAIASPVEKRSTDVTSGLDSTAAEIVSTVETLLGKLVTDVEAIANAAGVPSSDLLSGAGLSLRKREETGNEARSDTAIEAAVTTLITDVLGELVNLGTVSGVSLLSSLLSVLSL